MLFHHFLSAEGIADESFDWIKNVDFSVDGTEVLSDVYELSFPSSKTLSFGYAPAFQTEASLVASGTLVANVKNFVGTFVVSAPTGVVVAKRDDNAITLIATGTNTDYNSESASGSVNTYQTTVVSEVTETTESCPPDESTSSSSVVASSSEIVKTYETTVVSQVTKQSLHVHRVNQLPLK
ncbi:unnamed protein product [[Candida] boidinii]|nr:unnamed protein product [[Candida] boidinii]